MCLNSPNFGLNTPDFGLNSPNCALNSPNFGLKPPDFGLHSRDLRLGRLRLLSRGAVRGPGTWVTERTIRSMISSAVSSVPLTGSSLAESHRGTRPVGQNPSVRPLILLFNVIHGGELSMLPSDYPHGPSIGDQTQSPPAPGPHLNHDTWTRADGVQLGRVSRSMLLTSGAVVS